MEKQIITVTECDKCVCSRVYPCKFHPGLLRKQDNRESEVYFDTDKGVYRWATNDQIPPAECWTEYGMDKLPNFNTETQERVAQAETKAAIAAYRKNWRPPSGEHLAELQQEFGVGAEMVDAVAGIKFTI